jgi:PPOX class probable F420-dependent enzyme
MGMTKEAIDGFLQEKRMGVLGINREDAPPQLLPIWFRYDGEVVWMMSEKGVAKINHLKRDPRVSLCIDDPVFPYRGLVVYGTVTLTEENLQSERRAIARRYLGEAEGDAYVAQPRPRGTILMRLTPEKFYSFDNGTGRQT